MRNPSPHSNNTDSTPPISRRSSVASGILASTAAALAPVSTQAARLNNPDPESIHNSGSTNHIMAYFTTHHFSPQYADADGQHAPDTRGRNSLDSHGSTGFASSHHPSYQPVGRLAHLIDGLHFHVPHRQHQEQQQQQHSNDSKAKNTADITVTPRFDIAESHTAFTLYGELPGVAKGVGDLTVSVDDALATVTVSGSLVRGVPVHVDNVPVAHEDPVPEAKKEEAAESAVTNDDEPESKASTSEAPAEKKEEASVPAVPTEVDATPEPKSEEPKLGEPVVAWQTTERKVGRFRRVFHFASDEVVAERVHGGLHNGLLTIVVPKRVVTVPRERGAPRGSTESPPKGRRISLAEALPFPPF